MPLLEEALAFANEADADDVAAVATAVLVESFGAFLALDIDDDEIEDPGSDEAQDEPGDDDDD